MRLFLRFGPQSWGVTRSMVVEMMTPALIPFITFHLPRKMIVVATNSCRGDCH